MASPLGMEQGGAVGLIGRGVVGLVEEEGCGVHGEGLWAHEEGVVGLMLLS